MQQHAQSWRDLLAEVIKDVHERQRMAQFMDINPVTLYRWSINESRPRSQHHKKLIEAFPAPYRSRFAALFAVDYPDSLDPVSQQSDEPVDEIPSTFYGRIFDAYTNSPPGLRTSAILSLILQQMLSHLDSEQEGLLVSVALCTDPLLGQPVRTLREVIGRGTAPFDSHLEQPPYLLGAGTLAGSVVTFCREVVKQNLREDEGYIPFIRTDYEESSMAHPILFENRVAGSSLVSSTRIHFFTPVRKRLVQDYTNLMSLAFNPENFFDQSRIQLRVLPPAIHQAEFFFRFQQRIVAAFSRMAAQGTPVSRAQAEIIALREVEEKILRAKFDL